nr:metal-dependent hydrolase [Saprospiraceae bacterium]
MDSLTQMALGAAVGELVLGRKIGNKAMFWGAVAGTIPDLDVMANPFLSDAYSVKFHRGPSHSLLFSALFSVLAAFLIEKYFHSELFHKKWWRKIWKGVFTALPIGLAVLIIFSGMGTLSTAALISIVLLLGGTSFLAYRRSSSNPGSFEIPSYAQWYWFFFLVFVTHITLDVFTTYGTQVLWPFSDHPFALDNISVVDPVYTVPLLLSSLVASFFFRTDSKRKIFNRMGLLVSSLFIIFTLFNKSQVERVFTNTLKDEGLSFEKVKITPTLFNNLLWYGVADVGEEYITGYYSVLDEEPRFSNLQVVPKNHHLLVPYPQSPDIDYLKWFAVGFFAIEEHNDHYKWYDLRFGNIDFTKGSPEVRSPFYFNLIPDEEIGELRVKRTRPEFRGDVQQIWRAFWQRVWGVSSAADH